MNILKKIECKIFPCAAKLEKVLERKDVREELNTLYKKNRHNVMEALNGSPKRI